MKKLLLFITPTLLFLFLSCSKDIRKTNKIHGTWNIERISAVSSAGATTFSADPEGVMQFNKCDIHHEDFRAYRANYTYPAGATTVVVSETGAYRFYDGGERLVIRLKNGNSYHETVYYVTSFTNKKLEMETRNADNSKTVFVLEK
jgi:hypothetical protein